MANEVVIEIRADNDSAQAFDAVIEDVESLGALSRRQTASNIQDARRLATARIQQAERAQRDQYRISVEGARQERTLKQRALQDDQSLSAEKRRIQARAIADEYQQRVRGLTSERDLNLQRLRTEKENINEIARVKKAEQDERIRRIQAATRAEQAELTRRRDNYRRFFNDLRQSVLDISVFNAVDLGRNIGRDILQIATDTERAIQTLRKFSTEPEQLFSRLKRETQDLINLDVEGFTRVFVSLSAAGAEAEDVITVIRGMSQALAELGTSTFETDRFMQQLRQSFSANRVEGDDVKSLIEVMPDFLQRVSKELGVNVESWKDLQDILDNTGRTWRETIVAISRTADINANINLNTLSSQSALLSKEIRDLQRDIATGLTPALTSAVREIRAFYSIVGSGGITEFIAILGGAGVAIRVFGGSIKNLISTYVVLIRTQDVLTVSLQRAIGVATIESIKRGLVGLIATLRGFITTIATAKISMSTWLPIITATTAAIGYLAVRSEVAKNQATEFANAMARIADITNAGQTGQGFAGANREQLERALNVNISEQERITAQIAENNERIENTRRRQSGLRGRIREENAQLQLQLKILQQQQGTLEQLRTGNNAVDNSFKGINITVDDLNSKFRELAGIRPAGIIENFVSPLTMALNAVKQQADIVIQTLSEQQRLNELDRLSRRRPDDNIPQGTAAVPAIQQNLNALKATGAELGRYLSLQQRELDALERLKDKNEEQIASLNAARNAVNQLNSAYRNYIESLNVRPPSPDENENAGVFIPFDEILRGVSESGRSIGELGQRYNDFVNNARTAAQVSTAIFQTAAQSATDLAFSIGDITKAVNDGRTTWVRELGRIALDFIRSSVSVIIQTQIQVAAQKRLYTELANHAIAEQGRVAAAQGVGIPNIPNLGGIGNLGGLGNLLSGGAGALSVAGLLFPREFSNLFSGIGNEIKNANIVSQAGGLLSGLADSILNNTFFAGNRELVVNTNLNLKDKTLQTVNSRQGVLNRRGLTQ